MIAHHAAEDFIDVGVCWTVASSSAAGGWVVVGTTTTIIGGRGRGGQGDEVAKSDDVFDVSVVGGGPVVFAVVGVPVVAELGGVVVAEFVVGVHCCYFGGTEGR